MSLLTCDVDTKLNRFRGEIVADIEVVYSGVSVGNIVKTPRNYSITYICIHLTRLHSVITVRSPKYPGDVVVFINWPCRLSQRRH